MTTIVAVAGAVLLVAVLLLLVPATVFFAQVVAAGHQAPAREAGQRRPTVAVLMPAHDEAAGIAVALRALAPQLAAGDRLLVVADNCSDDTAAVAAACGAEVAVRIDPVRRGKGYALDHGLRYLDASSREVVVIVDADCIVAAGAIDLLARACAHAQRPIQARYLMYAPPGASLRQRMAKFAWVVRNDVRPSGWQRLGGPCQLMGTGMALPWPMIAKVSLASASIVEDMQLGLDFAAGGAAPRFCPEALVSSTFPQTPEGTLAQRTRWEHGHLGMIAGKGAPLLWRGIARGQGELVAMALDLCVPPLAVLVLSLTALALVAALMAAAGATIWPLGIAMVALALTIIATGLAWRRSGRSILSWSELLYAPAYALAKVPIYIRLFTARQLHWIRTKRDGSEG